MINKTPIKKKSKNEAMKRKRPDWDEYFISLIQEVAKRATCDRGRSGALIARNNRILSTGYVGSPPGLPHCDEIGHLMKKMVDEDGTVREHCVRTIHAEQNAIIQAAKYGPSIEGSTIYCKMEPCRVCAMMIISAGIKRIVCMRKYHAAQETREMFKRAGIELVVLKDEVQQYQNQ